MFVQEKIVAEQKKFVLATKHNTVTWFIRPIFGPKYRILKRLGAVIGPLGITCVTPSTSSTCAKGSGKQYVYDDSSFRSNMGHILPQIGPSIN